MKSTLIACLLLVLSFPAAAQTSPTPHHKTGKRQMPVLGEPSRELLQAVLDAWSTMDMSKPAVYYSKDPHNVFFDFLPLKYTGWQEYTDGVKREFGGYKSVQFTVNNDTEIHRERTFIWGTTTWHAVLLSKDDVRQELDGRWTAVWAKQSGKWLIVHDHFSTPLPEPQKK